jgi:aldehyde dehydrogenase (NAD+)
MVAAALPEGGCFYPPTLITGLFTASPLMQEEIFGPVLVSTTFRTPGEAVDLANDTRYGLAASIWTENVNVALDLAPRIRAGTVWVNCTNLFDAAAGFGGYRESGYGREGGIEGMREYLQPAWLAEDRVRPSPAAPQLTVGEGLFPAPGGGVRPPLSDFAAPSVDRTHKLYIGGKQQRPDEGYSLRVTMPDGTLLGEVPRGNRKDVRNAVEAARGAQPGWGSAIFSSMFIAIHCDVLQRALTRQDHCAAWRKVCTTGWRNTPARLRLPAPQASKAPAKPPAKGAHKGGCQANSKA